MMMNSKIDYKKLTIKELKVLIRNNDLKAEEEYDKRVFSGEIKLKRYKTLEELRQAFSS